MTSLNQLPLSPLFLQSGNLCLVSDREGLSVDTKTLTHTHTHTHTRMHTHSGILTHTHTEISEAIESKQD